MPTGAPDVPLIRSYHPEEFPILHGIDQICFPEYMAFSRAELRFFLQSRFSVARVAELTGAIVGFAAGWSEPGPDAHVVTLDVIREARRQRVGTMLMQALHDEFRSRNHAQAVLEVDPMNDAACRFYLGLGYRSREFLAGYYQGRRDALRMVMPL
jgi:ribosomal protein S18 acetylase RimI-like enzyme